MTLPYPPAPEIAQRLTTGGVPFDDPYHWLAEDTPETLQWQQTQDALAQAALAEGGAVERFEALLRPGFANMPVFYAPQPRAGLWFQRELPEGATLPVVRVSDTPGAPGRVVFDLASLGSPSALLHHAVPSPDGSRVLIVAPLMDAVHTLAVLVIDTSTGEVEHRLDLHGYMTAPIWLPGNAGFLFTGPPESAHDGAPPAPGMRIYEQRLDAAYSRTLVPLEHGHPVVMLHASADGRHAVVQESQVSPHPTYVRRLEGDAPWERFLDASFGLVKGTVMGEDFIALHGDERSPTRRLVAIPLASPRARETWRELLPASDATLTSVTPVAGRLVLGDSHEGHSRLRVLRADGTLEREIALPGKGAVGKFALGFIAAIVDDLVWADGDHIAFVHSSLRQAPRRYLYDLRTDRLQALGAPAKVLAGAEMTTLEARAEDGARVVYHVLRPRDASAPGPTVVTGYGGFNVPWLPCWSTLAAAWVEAGGTWVHAHLRGGGEFGEAFWRAGRMADKPNTFEDLYGVLRDVVRRGFTTADQLGIFGTSNGGVMVCAATSQRPELFAAGVAQVPLVDMHEVTRDPMPLSICTADYGNPLVEADARWLMRWSPYRTLRRGTRFPATLIDSSAFDTTCPPWHGRKFAAFLQNQGAPDSGPVLLRVRADAGHNEMTQAQFIRRDAEELAFLARQLGLDF